MSSGSSQSGCSARTSCRTLKCASSYSPISFHRSVRYLLTLLQNEWQMAERPERGWRGRHSRRLARMEKRLGPAQSREEEKSSRGYFLWKQGRHEQFWILFRRIQLLSQKTVILRAVTAIGSLLPVDLITADRDIDLHAQRTFVTACPPFQI